MAFLVSRLRSTVTMAYNTNNEVWCRSSLATMPAQAPSLPLPAVVAATKRTKRTQDGCKEAFKYNVRNFVIIL